LGFVRTHLCLLINPRSGDGNPSAEEVAAEAEKLGVEVHLLEKGENPADVARASGATTLGIAGGDGSLAAVAGVAIETGATFVCVPFGTRNHFARDVGLDRDDPIAALHAFVDGVEQRIDVGRAGGRLFLNNVSFGVYARLVHRREHRRRRGEALARLKALLSVARHRHALHAKVNDDPVRARAIFVGNNCYELSLFTVGERERLDEGELFLWTAAGWLPTSWEQKTARAFTIETGGERVRAAIDGEPVVLETPLELESLPGALRLLLPAGERREDDLMHDNPEPTEREQELAQTDRQNEEESQRYPSEGQPDPPDGDAEE
jgi:diacylglycerol kinase family enzyme